MKQEGTLLLPPHAIRLENYRHAQQFYTYWQSLHAERHIPLRSSFRPQSVSSLLPFIILLGYDSRAKTLAFRITGTALDNLLPTLKSGSDISMLQAYDTNNIIKTMAEKTLSTAEPQFFESSLGQKANLPIPDYGMIMVPFTSDGEACDLVMALFDFKSSIKDQSW